MKPLLSILFNSTGAWVWSKLPLNRQPSRFLNLLHACMLNRFSHFRLCATLWIAARQAPLSMGFSRQESWSRLPFPPPGDLPNPSLLHLLHWREGSLPLVPPGKPLITFYPQKRLKEIITFNLFPVCRKYESERKLNGLQWNNPSDTSSVWNILHSKWPGLFKKRQCHRKKIRELF